MFKIALFLTLFSFNSFAGTIIKRETIREWRGNYAETTFKAMRGEEVFVTHFTNVFGDRLGESRHFYFDRIDVESNGDSGIIGEKLQNCWKISSSNYGCKLVYQERKWSRDVR